MNNKNIQEPNSSKGYFQLKGMNAEKIVHDLATKTFLIDWCFLNPKLPDGKELCDLLIVFDEVAIIWQIKDLKLDEMGRYNQSEVMKNLRQLSGARRQLFDLKTPISLENGRRNKEIFDSSKINNVYLISVLLGEGEEAFSFVEEIKSFKIHIFTRDFTSIILNELDTISDFVDYISKKEEFVNTQKSLVILGGEEEFLAYFLKNGRNFDKFNKADHIMIQGGIWQHFQNTPEYKAKKKADRYFIYADDPDSACGRMLFNEFPHVFQFYTPGLIPANPVMTRHFGQGHLTSHFTHGFFKPFGRSSGEGQPGELFGLHGLAPRASNPADLERKIHGRAEGVEVTNRLIARVVPAVMHHAAATNRFF